MRLSVPIVVMRALSMFLWLRAVILLSYASRRGNSQMRGSAGDCRYNTLISNVSESWLSTDKIHAADTLISDLAT